MEGSDTEHYRDMFPPQYGRSSTANKEEKVPLNIRIPKSVKDYLEQAKAGGQTETSVVLRSLELGREIYEAMGNHWWEMVTLSVGAKQSFGTTLAQLAMEALKARASNSKKK